MKYGLALFIFFLLSACANSAPCNSKMDDIRRQYGEPEEVNTYDSEDYHSVDWWYWSKGIEYTFTWGSSVDGCEMSRYTFEPISGIMTAEMKTIVLQKRRLVFQTHSHDIR